MLGVNEYLGGAQGAGGKASENLCLIGGHYAFPGAPDRFAIESAREIQCAADRLSAAGYRVQSYCFLDDIAASEACSAVGCSTSTHVPRIGVVEMSHVSLWLEARLEELERMLVEADDPDWHGLALELAAALRKEQSATPDLASAALDPARVELEDWISAVEVLCYVVDRPRLRPLRLSRALRREAPPVLLERSMTNATSRMLHKLKKQPSDSEGLQVSQLSSGELSYWVAGADGRSIELRRESAERAANKCAGILSQLFNHCAKRVAAKQGQRLTIFYVIPCYDRARVQDGVTAFGRLYSDVRRWFNVDQLRIATALYCGPDRERLLCDELSLQHEATAELRTIQLAPDYPARVDPGAAPRPREIYADNNSTTATDPAVVAELLPYLTGLYGNASSSHSFGWTAELAVGQAARRVAALINAEADEIFFTSGATEANNWVFRDDKAASLPPIVSSAVEHKSVLEAVSHAAESGRQVIRLPINREGQVNLQALSELRLPARSLVSLMAVNNEVHGVLDLARAGEICAQKGAIFHTDAAQALGAIPIDVKRMRIGLMSLSAHKLYGPKGVGALYVERGLQSVLRPFMLGGGQQGNLRSGTLPTALIVGLGKACALVAAELATEAPRLEKLARSFLQQLSSRGVSYRIIGPSNLQQRRPGSLCLAVEDLDCTRLCEWMPEVAISQGSACNSRGVGSHVLRELGLSVDEARSVIRLAFGRFNGERDVTYVVKRLVSVQQEHRRRRPAAGQWAPQSTAV